LKSKISLKPATSVVLQKNKIVTVLRQIKRTMTAQSSEDYHCITSPPLSLYTLHSGVKLLTSRPTYLQFGFFNSSGIVTEMRAL